MTIEDTSRAIAEKWCANKGPGWQVGKRLGSGATAPVFEIHSPDGERALKVQDEALSSGAKGEIESKRVEQQLSLKGHSCPTLVQIYDGCMFEGRIVLLMGRAPGRELEKYLSEVPREKIRSIVDQVARTIEFLREKKLCHRDIKAANIFVTDDFERVTVLDLSVMRDIYDPVGLGTDRDGQLPVIATARYSPPEYLFRLVDPGPSLWHALDIYQLGGLLHDLIMRNPLFEAEFQRSKENRYRFAWLVATIQPTIDAADVDQDLVHLARRALDKDWERRSTLSISDFFSTARSRQLNSLSILGIATSAGKLAPDTIGMRLERIRKVAETLDVAIAKFLWDNNARAQHETSNGENDLSKIVQFTWTLPDGQLVTFKVELAITKVNGKQIFQGSSSLAVGSDTVTIPLPAVEDVDGAEAALVSQAEFALAELAVKMSNRSREA